jgi:hypothetical protein
VKAEDAKWFRPLWVRAAVTIGLAGWCAYEWLINKDEMWGTLVGACLIYSLYNFFYAFPKETAVEPIEPASPPPGNDRNDP